MTKSLKWRIILIGGVTIIALFYLAPTLFEPPSWWKAALPAEKINLGLDLKGGMHLVLEVEVERAVENTAERLLQELKEELKGEKIPFSKIERIEGTKLLVELPPLAQKEKLDKILKDKFPILEKLERKEEGTVRLKLGIKKKEAENIQKFAVEQALETISNRIDQFGVAEPTIQRQEANRILIQLPGIKEPERAKDLIGKTALLEFKLVDEEHSLEEALKGNIPEGDEILYQRRVNPETGEATKTPYLLKKNTLLTGEFLSNAQVRIGGQFNEPYVAISFNSQGAKLFDRITAENVQKRLAIILDNNVYSAPAIQERISGGEAQITGRFTTEEAHDLAIVLKAGSLPAPVEILEENTVGPSLGKDSIRRGISATIVGGLAVILFMAIYYKLSGMVADLALILNLILILAVLSAFRATLTLPGIAGIVLTLGMAVDANVLIFERIREELRTGKTPRAALEAGYSRAFSAILDSNLTTLLAGLVLFQFGTGPVKGFAVTLSIGILSSLFTALTVTRVIFDYFLLKRRVKTLSV